MRKYEEYVDAFMIECGCFERGESIFGAIHFNHNENEEERVKIFRYLKALKPEYADVMTLISVNGQPAPIHIHFDRLNKNIENNQKL